MAYRDARFPAARLLDEHQLKRIKDDELIRLKRETSVIQDDLNLVESLVENVQQMKIEVADPDDLEGKIYTGVKALSKYQGPNFG